MNVVSQHNKEASDEESYAIAFEVLINRVPYCVLIEPQLYILGFVFFHVSIQKHFTNELLLKILFEPHSKWERKHLWPLMNNLDERYKKRFIRS